MKVQSQIDDLLTLRASEWFEILKSPTERQRAEFIVWLSESRRHIEEFLEVAAVDNAVGGVSAELRENLDSLVARFMPKPADLPLRAKPQPWTLCRYSRAGGGVAFWSMAAGVLLAIAIWVGVYALYFFGAVQLLFVIPMVISAAHENNSARVKGIMIAAAVTVMLNVACSSQTGVPWRLRF